MKFFVPQRLEPGVYRPAAGLVKPGGVLELGPDEIPPPLLVPLDPEAQAALQRHHGIVVPILPAAPRLPTSGDEMSHRSYAEYRLGMKATAESGTGDTSKKSSRAADR